MARALSEDLRGRVIDAVEGGMSRRAAAERFGIGAATAVRWVSECRRTGVRVARRQGGDNRSQRIETYRDAIFEAVRKQPDLTQVELSEWLMSKFGEAFAPSTVWRFFDRHGLTFKKNGARRRAGSP